jgi:amino acid transporter
MVSQSQSSAIRYGLATLLGFGAINAFGGGYYGLSGAPGVPVVWLEGGPFSDYTVPSLILLIVVGGSLLVAAVAVLAHSGIARASALTAGAVVLVWIVVQVAIIGYVSWMQPATANTFLTQSETFLYMLASTRTFAAIHI